MTTSSTARTATIVLSGGEGNDLVAAGAGNDSLEGGSGADLLFDETGQDTVRGGAGDDRVVAALDEDRDTYDGGEGAADALDLTATEAGVSVDLAAGSAEGEEIGDNAVTGFEIVEGGAGNDSLAGSEGGETLSGAGGEDLIEGRAGDDTISGGDGDDRLLDGAGEDSVTGGAGNDVVSAAADGNDDAYEGSDGEDVLDYSQSEESIIVDLVTMTASGADIGEDVIGGFESVIGGSGDDSFLVGQQAMILEGGSGDDLFEFVPPPTSESEPVHVLHEIVDFRPATASGCRNSTSSKGSSMSSKASSRRFMATRSTPARRRSAIATKIRIPSIAPCSKRTSITIGSTRRPSSSTAATPSSSSTRPLEVPSD